jgi:hypothetical protein
MNNIKGKKREARTHGLQIGREVKNNNFILYIYKQREREREKESE